VVGLTIVSAINIAAQFPPVVIDLGLIMPEISAIPPAIIGKHRSHAHPDQQQHSRNRPFHIRTLLRVLRILLNRNTASTAELRFSLDSNHIAPGNPSLASHIAWEAEGSQNYPITELPNLF
jgi:hypothetical protein